MMLEDYNIAYGLESVSFRYFNAAGSDSDGDLGQLPNDSHIIPRIFENVLFRKPFSIFGIDYNTTDGTCIRDYVHVNDIAEAHINALDLHNVNALKVNLGSGKSYSVLELVNLIQKITRKTSDYEIKNRRPGDPDKLLADISYAKNILNFRPRYMIEDVIISANKWYENDIYKELRKIK